MQSFSYVSEACNLKTNYMYIVDNLNVKDDFKELTIDVAKRVVRNKCIDKQAIEICKKYIKLWKEMQNG
jgi:hypothetical protein